jgi:hypothetical protein
MMTQEYHSTEEKQATNIIFLLDLLSNYLFIFDGDVIKHSFFISGTRGGDLELVCGCPFAKFTDGIIGSARYITENDIQGIIIESEEIKIPMMLVYYNYDGKYEFDNSKTYLLCSPEPPKIEDLSNIKFAISGLF